MFKELISNILGSYAVRRVARVSHASKYPKKTQRKVFLSLIQRGRLTDWGRKHSFGSIKTIEDFRKNVPLSTYEDLYPWIERALAGERNILWPGKVKMFAKSSGTTNARSKFIPVTKASLHEAHFRGGKDMIALYLERNPKSTFLFHKSLAITGSLAPSPLHPNILCGDVSAVLTKQLPLLAEINRVPARSIALLSKWEDKAKHIVVRANSFDVSSLIGTPTWVARLVDEIIKKNDVKDIFAVWPNLEVFFHGAVSFRPYRPLFKDLFGDRVQFVETYNASEGFFAIQDVPDQEGMLLMLDYGIFYEFIPMTEFGNKDATVYTIEEVKEGINYAVVISTSGGLWRYIIGDTVRFVSTKPYRVVITGRTKQFINAFGEEVVVENVEQAVLTACLETGAIIENFTVGPQFMTHKEGGHHQWVVEFSKLPDNTKKFEQIIDETVRSLNSDYDAKRNGDAILAKPIFDYVPLGTFYTWMKERGKLGGQHKVPRLANDREYVDAIMNLINQHNKPKQDGK